MTSLERRALPAIVGGAVVLMVALVLALMG
jgi:hypothetical protein